MSILASDDFNRANGTLGANWTTRTGESAMAVVSNQATPTDSSNNCSAYYSGALIGGGAWPADQYAESTLGATLETATDNGGGATVRCATAANTAYFCQSNSVETRIYKAVAGAYTQLGSDGAAGAVGSLIRLTASGTSITCAKNGSAVVGPVTDSSIASGNAGIRGSSASLNGPVNSWEGGDLLTASALAGPSRQMFLMGLGA